MKFLNRIISWFFPKKQSSEVETANLGYEEKKSIYLKMTEPLVNYSVFPIHIQRQYTEAGFLLELYLSTHYNDDTKRFRLRLILPPDHTKWAPILREAAADLEKGEGPSIRTGTDLFEPR